MRWKTRTNDLFSNWDFEQTSIQTASLLYHSSYEDTSCSRSALLNPRLKLHNLWPGFAAPLLRIVICTQQLNLCLLPRLEVDIIW